MDYSLASFKELHSHELNILRKWLAIDEIAKLSPQYYTKAFMVVS